MRPSCAGIIRPWKTEGAGNAGCPMHPQPRAQSVVKHTSVVTTVTPDSPGIPYAMVLTAYLVLSRRRIRLVTVISGLRDCLSPVGPTRLRKFNTSNGCQDHTALPSAAIVVRLRAVDRSRAFRQPALRSRHTPNAAASTASHPASVTIAIRPSGGRDGEGSRTDLGQTGTGIFLQMGLGNEIAQQPAGQISRLLFPSPLG